MEASRTDKLPVAIGACLGKCLLTQVLGAGSAAVVYRAQHQTLHIPVAVKVLRPALLGATPSQRDDLRAEAMFLAEINHPRFVRVLDFDEQGLLPYFVMELIEGQSLMQRLEASGPLPVGCALDLVIQTARGLAAAWKRGIVHCDLKPANLLLTRRGTVKIIDLGLAFRRHQPRRVPASSAVVGTVAYVSPEQAQDVPLDFRADVYSLGATFYHAVTGRIPFEGASCVEVLIKHALEAPLPPQHFNRRLPRAVADVILTMLAKRPADRFGSPAALLAALAALQSDQERPVVRLARPALAGTELRCRLPSVRAVLDPLPRPKS